jgi:hypothetical protein
MAFGKKPYAGAALRVSALGRLVWPGSARTESRDRHVGPRGHPLFVVTRCAVLAAGHFHKGHQEHEPKRAAGETA